AGAAPEERGVAVALVGQQHAARERSGHLLGPLVGGGRVADGADDEDGRRADRGRRRGGLRRGGPVVAAGEAGAEQTPEGRRRGTDLLLLDAGLLLGEVVVLVRAVDHGLRVARVVVAAVGLSPGLTVDQRQDRLRTPGADVL